MALKTEIKLSAIPARWKIGLPMFALVFAAVLLLKRGPESAPSAAPEAPTITERLSRSVLSLGDTRDWNVNLGVKLAKAKHYSAARKVFEALHLIEPDNASVLNNLAFVTAEMGDVPKAIEYLQLAVQAAGDSCAECHNNLGSLLLKQEKIAEAKGAFEKAARIDGNYVDAKLHLAMLAEQESDWSGALEWYRQAMGLVEDPELKTWIASRASWMVEITTSTKRQVSGGK